MGWISVECGQPPVDESLAFGECDAVIHRAFIDGEDEQQAPAKLDLLAKVLLLSPIVGNGDVGDLAEVRLEGLHVELFGRFVEVVLVDDLGGCDIGETRHVSHGLHLSLVR